MTVSPEHLAHAALVDAELDTLRKAERLHLANALQGVTRLEILLDQTEQRLRDALLAYLPKVGMQKEDETGWRMIEAIEWNAEGKPEFQVVDKHGAEHLLTAQELGTGWTA